MSISDA
jgi:pimeloyl-ACP methyl ester carboxylesterase